ncbi:MAG: hypothetical protein GTO18_03285 [Anaerolineales bacterium]|nr:hypothetical protein [Anaerolineales bacterium]
MDPVIVGAFLLAVLLRIGLPILITALIVWGLRKLDAHWQSESEEQELDIREIVAVQRTPCWEFHGCPEYKRQDCPAYLNPTIPCWQHFRNGRGELRVTCLDCQVFREAPLPMAA